MHRPPPKEQGKFERYSVVFFTRAHDNVELRALVEDSPLVADAVEKTPNGRERFWPGVTARDWLERRVRGQRIKHFTVRCAARATPWTVILICISIHRVQRASQAGWVRKTLLP